MDIVVHVEWDVQLHLISNSKADLKQANYTLIDMLTLQNSQLLEEFDFAYKVKLLIEI